MTKGQGFSAPSASRRWKTGRRDQRGIAGMAVPVLVTSVRCPSGATKLIISYPTTRTRGVHVGGSGHVPNSPVARADHLSRCRQGADIVAQPRFDSADHHGKDGGILPPGYLVAADGGWGKG